VTFSSVAWREMVMATRRPATFRIRLGSALLASGVTFLMLLFVGVTGAVSEAGRVVFWVLVWGCHVFAVLSGALLTADCISEERRDGTLGLMFLTELGGVDVVAGKFAGNGLNALFGLGAVFPVMAISWFLGGVTAGEFGRACLVLLNDLFVSVASGLVVSAWSRRQSDALRRVMVLLAVWYIGVPVAEWLMERARVSEVWLWWGGISPTASAGFVADPEYRLDPAGFWRVLAMAHAVGWMFLGMAVWRVESSWRTEENEVGRGLRERRRLNRALLERDPVRALLAGSRASGVWGWGCAGVGWVWAMVGVFGDVTFPGVFTALGWVLLGIASWESVAFIGEARREGTFELLLATPVNDGEIKLAVVGHVLRRFIGPVLTLLLADAVLSVVPMKAGAGDIFSLAARGTGVVLQGMAIPYVGLWFALSERKPLVAFGKTFGFVVLLSTPLLYVCCVGLVVPPLMTAWANTKLRIPLREIIVGVRSEWQRRQGWLYSTRPPGAGAGDRRPPPLPLRRDGGEV
jgi:hypothetical protein